MSFLTPTQMFATAACITPQYLKKHNINTLLLDVDNTLTAHGSQELPTYIKEWLDIMRASGIKMMIVSNNTKKRITPFAKRIGLKFVSFAIKPLPLGLARAIRALGAARSNTALVGDQVFTDMLAAKLLGIKIFMVQPLSADTIATIRLKRTLEKPFISLYYKNGGTLIK